MILIDNYDSFTYNLVQYLRELGVEPRVFKNDEITIDGLKKLDFESILISPGPGNPDTAGICLDVVKEFAQTKKILGVCLGHQCIAQAFGGKIVQAKEPVHGKVSEIFFDESEPIFDGISQGFLATRYHSLVVDEVDFGKNIEPIARTLDGVIMALKHKKFCLYGVQFHPEAILTEYGKKLLSNFISLI
ncbi:MAG: aminodeoxychorismate/anthranilate synthase component II [Candidatus Gastranaerophilales bacterium]|nr:aminodeoxychorismate/anthranilate synthase component II [Candidatus Gastranaerophilales bacterium]